MTDLTDPLALVAIAVALGLGGVLKGALGMGSPLIAVPVMASFVDVRIAVAVMVVPHLITNGWQLLTFRGTRLNGRLPWIFAGAGALGTLVGTILLASLPSDVLRLFVSLAVFLFVGLRVTRPSFTLSHRLADRLAAPLGALGGMMHGAAGVSAPISVSFLNAMHLPRDVFIPTISLFFMAITSGQVMMMIPLGLLTPQIATLGCLALVPMLAGMPLGARLARAISVKNFDRITLVVLTLLGVKLSFDALF